jgi:hypothetical protein
MMKKYDSSTSCRQLLENMDFQLIVITIMDKNPKLSSLVYMIDHSVQKLNRMMEKNWGRDVKQSFLWLKRCWVPGCHRRQKQSM